MLLKLQNFEGPIELLYSLIGEKKLDVCQISLAEVTNQYLSYIKYYQETDPKNLSEFLVIAARLILIKSKMLLPSLEISNEEEDEINELQRKLEIYKRLKEVSKTLKKFHKNSLSSFSREFLASQQIVFLPPPNIAKHSLAGYLQNLIVKIPKPATLPQETLKAVISFEDIIKNLHHRIANAIHKTFSEAISNASSKMEIIVHFLAMLELVKQKKIDANQDNLFGEITFIKYEN